MIFFLLHPCNHFSSMPSGYVGAATVGAAAWWYTMYEKGPQLNYYQLVSEKKEPRFNLVLFY